MATRIESLSYLDMSDTHPNGDGTVTAQIRMTKADVEFQSEPIPGTAFAKTVAAGLCSSEIAGGGYYGRIQPETGTSRYMSDRENIGKLELARQRQYEVGFAMDTEMITPLLRDTGFHEGVVRIESVQKDPDAPIIPIPFYAPQIVDGSVRLVKVPFSTNFQNGFKLGDFAALDPAIICNYHADERKHRDEVERTGWTRQCDRSLENGHQPKETRGHVGAPGTIVNGLFPISLATMTPLSTELNKYLQNGDQKRLLVPLNIEPMGCVFHTFGPFLAQNKVPDNIVLVGDGANTLNMLAFIQAFAPESRVLVVGKTPEKLDVLRSINPGQIATITTNGNRDYSEVDRAFHDHTGAKKADVIVPMIPIDEEIVTQRLVPGGTAIWWAASKAEHNPKFMVKRDGITHILPYGGAPNTEFSAVELFDYLLRHRPEVLQAYLDFPGIAHIGMGQEAATATQQWLNNGGRYVDSSGMSKKPVYYM